MRHRARHLRSRFFLLTLVSCIVTLYIMIKSFRHRGLERFFQSGSKAGIQPKHAQKLRLQLFALDNAKNPYDLNAPGWHLHPLTGALKDNWAISVSGNWRLTFKFEKEDAILVDYQDYH
jgi:proteic killer suppression protein